MRNGIEKENLTLGESTTADKLRKLLDSGKYSELLKYLSRSDPKYVSFDDLYKFAGKKMGFLEDFNC